MENVLNKQEKEVIQVLIIREYNRYSIGFYNSIRGGGGGNCSFSKLLPPFDNC